VASEFGEVIMSEVLRDVVISIRLLRKTPSATLGMLVSLALGVGACTTIFSWINGILLQPFPAVASSGKYMVLASRTPSGTLEPLSYAAYVDIREAAPVFDSLVAVGVTLNTLNLGTEQSGNQVERVFANFVSGNYFDALGVGTETGRGFRDDEDRVPGRDPVVVISHGLWQRSFGGVADVVGRTIHLNGRPCVVIGVADRGFVGTLVGLSADLWIPMAMRPALLAGAQPLEDRGARWVVGLGRLKAQMSRAEADARLHAIAQELTTQFPDTDDREAVVIPIWRSPWGAQGGTGPVLMMLAAVVAFLLLLSCANAANLLLARAVGRRRDIALRLAVGASRFQIIRQLLVESMLLALSATLLGVVIAYAASDVVLEFLPPTDSPFVFGSGVDGTVLAFALGLAVVALLVSGLTPALKASRPDLVTVLKEEQGTTVAAASRLRSTLVTVQIALCVVLLAGAGLFLRSLQHARRVSPGFSPDGVMLVSYDLSQLGYDARRGRLFHQQALENAARIPGVAAASLASRVPLGFTPMRSLAVSVDGYVASPGEDRAVNTNVVAPDYFRVLRIPVRQGREFSNADASASEPVAIVNETMAKRYWSAGGVVGSYVRSGQRRFRIVGVVADSKYRALTESPQPHLYLLAGQDYEPRMTLHLRTSADQGAILPFVRAEMQRLDPGLVLSDIQSLRTHLGVTTLVARLSASFLGSLGGAALVIATLGIYSVVAFVIAARTRELGVRLALGASSRSIRLLVIGHGLKLAASGIIIGLLLAVALGRLVAGLLVDVSPMDPLALGAVALVVAGVAVGVSLVPAIRAGRLEVMTALG
jgi:macrolide transport system ATP-binding/permease protein